MRELRIGKYHVFYNVDEEGQRVMIRRSRETAPPDNRGGLVKVIGIDEANIEECVKDASASACFSPDEANPSPSSSAWRARTSSKSLEAIPISSGSSSATSRPQ